MESPPRTSSSIRVVMVEDHHLVRAGLVSLVSNLDTVEVIGEAATGPEGLQIVGARRPDIAIFDINLPEKNGLECCREITERFPETRVLILSMHATAGFVHQAIEVGASGYLLKDAAQSELEIAILALARNESYFSPEISTHLLTAVRKGGLSDAVESAPSGENPFDRITARQREVLRLVLEGCNSKQIASRLGLSVKTVENHRQHIQHRLEIYDTVSLTKLALQWKFISHSPTLDFD